MIALTDILIRLAVAALLGSLIGLERQRHDRVAGLRTHMLVCVGSALAMIVSMDGFGDVVTRKGVDLDPSRVAAQVVSGIGFLGAGTIFFMKSEVVKGLTTAAGIWTVSMVGLAVGGGLYITAVATIVIVLIILAAIKPIEQKFFDKNKYTTINLEAAKGDTDLKSIRDALEKQSLGIREIKINSIDDKDHIRITILKATANQPEPLSLLQDLRVLKGVKAVEFSSH